MVSSFWPLASVFGVDSIMTDLPSLLSQKMKNEYVSSAYNVSVERDLICMLLVLLSVVCIESILPLISPTPSLAAATSSDINSPKLGCLSTRG